MANVKFPRKEFEKKVKKIDENMKEKIALFGTPLESLTNDEIELEIFPNRPDLLSLQGYLRSFLAFLGKKTGLRKYKINKPEKNFKVKIDSSVKSVRPFTACAIVKNLNFDDEKIKEIVDIQEKLHATIGRNRKKMALGIYPLEKIVLPITYKTEIPEKIKFVPLESNQEMNGKQILSGTPTGREYSHLLQGMDKFPVFRDAKGNVLSMPPIINSHLTGKITENTKEVFIECSGHDFEILKKILNIVVTTLSDMGGEVYSMNLQYGNKKIKTPDLTSKKIKIDLKDCEKLLGIKLKEKQISKFLREMGYDYKKKNAEVPAWRTDVLHPVDIYEDVAIAYGYNNFVPEIPEVATVGEESNEEIKKRKIAEVLVGLRFLEVSSYHLTTKKDIRKTGFRIKTDKVLDSKTDFDTLKPSLLVSLMKIFSENINSQYPQKIFEVGEIFDNLQEKNKLGIAVSGETDFTEIKQVLDYLMKSLDLEYKIEEAEHPSFISGRTAKVILSKIGKEIGFFGEISPYVLKNWHIKMPTVALEIDIEEL